jgi:flagellar assembly protein FliH
MNTTNVIPKEKLPVYQRWEPDTFDKAENPTPNIDESTSGNAKSNNQEEEKILDEAKVNEIYLQTKEEGHAAGFQEGHTAGHQEGRQLAETEVKAEVENMHILLSALNKELNEIDQAVAQDLLTLALNLSKKMTSKALQVHPELIIPIVQEAMKHLPHTSHPPHLILHPDDADLIRKYLSDQQSQSDWEICEDEQIEKGGCRIKTSGSEIDASTPTRWQRILSTIGQEDNWLKQSSDQTLDNE